METGYELSGYGTIFRLRTFSCQLCRKEGIHFYRVKAGETREEKGKIIIIKRYRGKR